MSVYGLDLDPLPENWTPIEATVIVKCLDQDGVLALVTRHTKGITSWEVVGLLTASLDTERADLQSSFQSDRDDDE